MYSSSNTISISPRFLATFCILCVWLVQKPLQKISQPSSGTELMCSHQCSCFFSATMNVMFCLRYHPTMAFRFQIHNNFFRSIIYVQLAVSFSYNYYVIISNVYSNSLFLCRPTQLKTWFPALGILSLMLSRPILTFILIRFPVHMHMKFWMIYILTTNVLLLQISFFILLVRRIFNISRKWSELRGPTRILQIPY
jgi:hypothetical protein